MLVERPECGPVSYGDFTYLGLILRLQVDAFNSVSYRVKAGLVGIVGAQ